MKSETLIAIIGILIAVVLVSGCIQIQEEVSLSSVKDIQTAPINNEIVKLKGYLGPLEISSGLNCLNADYLDKSEGYKGPSAYLLFTDNESGIQVDASPYFKKHPELSTAGAPIFYGSFVNMQITARVRLYEGSYNLEINNITITCIEAKERKVPYLELEDFVYLEEL